MEVSETTVNETAKTSNKSIDLICWGCATVHNDTAESRVPWHVVEQIDGELAAGDRTRSEKVIVAVDLVIDLKMDTILIASVGATLNRDVVIRVVGACI